MGAPGIQEIVVILLILLMTVPWVWSLIHCIQNKRLTDKNRIIGIILIAVLGIIGSLVYLFLPRISDQPPID